MLERTMYHAVSNIYMENVLLVRTPDLITNRYCTFKYLIKNIRGVYTYMSRKQLGRIYTYLCMACGKTNGNWQVAPHRTSHICELYAHVRHASTYRLPTYLPHVRSLADNKTQT